MAVFQVFQGKCLSIEHSASDVVGAVLGAILAASAFKVIVIIDLALIRARMWIAEMGITVFAEVWIGHGRCLTHGFAHANASLMNFNAFPDFTMPVVTRNTRQP